jgi:Tol biopolymer transport system component
VQVVAVGGGERRTIFDPGSALQAMTPQWSPDGRWLAVRVV